MSVYELIKLSLWDQTNTCIQITKDEYEEMRKHTLVSLPAPVLSKIKMQDDLRQTWIKAIYQQVAYCANYQYVQSRLPIKVPYVILKGTSAAKYYPYPEYRTLGDIDIMTRREDYEHACQDLIDNGWEETTSKSDLKRGRHRTFRKNNIVIENHAFFASMNDPVKAKAFDDLIVENMTDSHVLPELINGLVLIDHVNQHLEEGIGLRQIIDWMMFVDKCLKNNEEWVEFENLAEKTGLKKLAIVTTRMCEMYLGLSKHEWSSHVKEKLCHELMDYVMKSGNFGTKKNHEEALAVSRMNKLRHPFLTIKELQRQGRKEWNAGNKLFFRRFAWVWRGYQFLKDTPQCKNGFKQARKLNSMFNALGVKRLDDGLVYYIDGQYVKK